MAPTPAASATPAPRPLTVRVEATGTGALEWLPLVAVPSEAASCAWSGDEGVVFEDPAACATRVMAPAAGNWSVAVRATAAGRSADGAAVLEATLPQADGSVTGSLYAYNEAQGQTVGLSNVLAEAAGRPVYPPEAQVVLSARSVEGDGVDDATPAVAFLLDGNGTVWGGPLPLAGGDEASGALPGTGWRFDSEPWTLPAEAGAGVYLLAVRLEVAGQQVWVQDGDGAAPGGHKEIQVVAAP